MNRTYVSEWNINYFSQKTHNPFKQQKHVRNKFLSNMPVISAGKRGSFSSTPHHSFFFPLIFLFISCSVIFTPSWMQMFFCCAVIIRVCQWLLMHLLLPFAQISLKNLLYWENSCFSMPLFAFHIIAMHDQPHTKVSLAEEGVIESLVVHQFWGASVLNLHSVS